MLYPRFFFTLILLSFLSGCDLQQQEPPDKPIEAQETKKTQEIQEAQEIQETRLERVKKAGLIRVLTRYDSTTYYEGSDDFSGLEYDLVKLFAQRLGVKVQFILPDTFSSVIQKTAAGEVDFAAAGISITEEREKNLLFAPAYQKISEQLIFRSGTKQPKKIADLKNGILEVVKGTSHEQTLLNLKAKHKGLQWQTNANIDTDGLLFLVNERLIDYTIADSTQVQLIRRFYPKLNVAFTINPARYLAWAFQKSDDLSLYDEATAFFKQIKKDKTLAQLIERHYGHTRNIKYVGNCKFQLHYQSRLPRYQELFQQAATQQKMDWRLLASISYQESHWNPYAVSPTGVKGLMMLTQATAKQMGVKDRTNPKESIFGGARYFKQRINTIPERIPEPDRTWFALASYNIGFGHLEDARIITQSLGKNPDKWLDVKQALPLLTQKKWYSKTKHGYARGREPVVYVHNIRSYLDLLLWQTSDKKVGEDGAMPKLNPALSQ